MSDPLKILAALNTRHEEMAQQLIDDGCTEHCCIVARLEQLLEACGIEAPADTEQDDKVLNLDPNR